MELGEGVFVRCVDADKAPLKEGAVYLVVRLKTIPKRYHICPHCREAITGHPKGVTVLPFKKSFCYKRFAPYNGPEEEKRIESVFEGLSDGFVRVI